MCIQTCKDFNTWSDGAPLAADGGAQIAADDRRRQGAALPQDDCAFIESHFKCPACLYGPLRRRPLFDRLDGSRRLSTAYVCSSCCKGYLIRLEGAAPGAKKFASGCHWDMPSEAAKDKWRDSPNE